MIGWIEHQRHLWSADETKLFIANFSKANQQLCDVTEAIWLAVSPNIAQNGLRTLSEMRDQESCYAVCESVELEARGSEHEH